MRYAVVIENIGKNYSTHAPDLQSCALVGGTLEEGGADIREVIAFHLEGMREDGSRSRQLRGW